MHYINVQNTIELLLAFQTYLSGIFDSITFLHNSPSRVVAFARNTKY